MTDQKDKKGKIIEFLCTYKYVILVSFFALSAIIATVLTYRFHFNGITSTTNTDWRTFGDFFGGVLNPILAFLSFVILLYTVQLQIKELKENRLRY